MVVACIALLVALGGTSYATALNVPRNSVGTLELQRNAVKAAKIAPNAVRTGHVLDGSLLVADFKAGQIPQGPKGDKGDKGDKGEKGAPGVSGYQVVEATNQFVNAFVRPLSVNCPAGKKVLGGGVVSTPVGGDGPFLSASRPTSTGWTATSVRSVMGAWTMTVYAICGVVTP